MAVGLLDRLYAVRPWDLALESDRKRSGPAEISIVGAAVSAAVEHADRCWRVTVSGRVGRLLPNVKHRASWFSAATLSGGGSAGFKSRRPPQPCPSPEARLGSLAGLPVARA